METIEIFWNDLTEAKQKELLALLGDNRNWDVFPLATIDLEDYEDEEEDVCNSVSAKFVSVWDDEFTFTSECRVVPSTKEVFDIEMLDSSDVEQTLNQRTREYIILNGKEYDVFQRDELGENKDHYWYD